MGWRSTERLPAYTDQASRDAYRAGYSDGYHHHPRDPGDWPVQPYSKGYWEGQGDRDNPKEA